MAKRNLTYNEAMVAIEEILSRLNNNELDVDELSAAVGRASELIRQCREKLRKAESEITDILKEE